MTDNEQIRFLRQKKGWTQEDLAYEAEVTLRTIQSLESGASQGSGETLRRVALALGVTVNYILLTDAQYDEREAQRIALRIAQRQAEQEEQTP